MLVRIWNCRRGWWSVYTESGNVPFPPAKADAVDAVDWRDRVDSGQGLNEQDPHPQVNVVD